ncbi:MAG: XRE family transcriptional regulator [Anaerolineae bacterium]|nr:XRE family transcriptional regulator [Anaerolineae bacterium]
MTFSDWIAEELKARDISQRQLAKLAGIAQGHLSNVLTGKRALTADMVIQIANALEVSPVVALTKAGILPPQEQADINITLQELMDIARQLPEDAQQELLDYARFKFRRS